MPSSTITVGVSSSTACSKTISVNSSYIIDSIDFYGIDRLVECIDKIRKLDDRDKELLSKLFDSHK